MVDEKKKKKLPIFMCEEGSPDGDMDCETDRKSLSTLPTVTNLADLEGGEASWLRENGSAATKKKRGGRLAGRLS